MAPKTLVALTLDDRYRELPADPFDLSATAIGGFMPRTSKPRNISTSDDLWEQVEREAAESGLSRSAIVTAALGQYFRSKIMRSSWSVEDDDGWYDPNKFYTYTEDKHHHSAKVTMNVPKNIAGAIQNLVTSGKVPELKSPSDFYRSALFHYAHRIGKMADEGELVAEVSVAMLKAEHDAIIQQRKDMDELIASIREVFDQCLSQDDTVPYVEARLKLLWARASTIPEMFKKDYVDTLEEYGTKLRAVKDGGVRPIVRGRGRITGTGS